MEKIYKFAPELKTTIWGGDKIRLFRRLDTDQERIGESWELSAVPGSESRVDMPGASENGETLSELVTRYGSRLLGEDVKRRFGDKFPLLVKFIDAQADLSLQVHPDDETAMLRHNQLGKTEMWLVLDTMPGARIHSGLKRSIDKAEYDRRVADGTLMEVVKSFDSEPGDFYYLPAGRMHAIGAGNFLVEIQESSDVTYRVDDYGRLDSDGRQRQLHTSEARDVIDFGETTDGVTKTHYNDSADVWSEQTLVDCPYFRVKLLMTGHKGIMLLNPDPSFAILTVLSGSGTVSAGATSVSVDQGDTVLLPAAQRQATVSAGMKVLMVTIPESK